MIDRFVVGLLGLSISDYINWFFTILPSNVLKENASFDDKLYYGEYYSVHFVGTLFYEN